MATLKLKAGNIKGLGKHLAKKYGAQDKGFFTRCMAAEELADYDRETRAAICAKAHKVQIGKWPAEKKEKQMGKIIANIKAVFKGGAGSGHHGHAGRPGKVGGSASSGGGGKGKGGASLSREEYNSKTDRPNKGTAKDGLILLSNAIATRVASTSEISNLKYKKYKKGFRIEDRGGFFGNMTTSIGTKELSDFGFTPDSFSTYLDQFGAGKIKPRKRSEHFVYMD